MFVLGIDPGVSRCGYGAVAADAGSGDAWPCRGRWVHAPHRRRTRCPQRLATLDAELRALLAELRPDAVAVERVFFQTNARTAMSVGQASGLALVAARRRRRARVVQYTPNEVKQAVAGYGAAAKEQVQRMVQSLLGLAELPQPADAADALALALLPPGDGAARGRIGRVRPAGRAT